MRPLFYIAIFYVCLLSYLGYKERMAEGGDYISIGWTILFSIFGTGFLYVFISETAEKLKGNDGYGWAGIIGLFLLTLFFVAIVLFIPWIN